MNLFDLFIKIEAQDRASDVVIKLGNESTKTADKMEELSEASESSSGKLSNFASKLGSGLATAAKIGTAAITAASAAIVALTKSSLDAYAEHEQLVGGVETLFKTSSDKVQQYAQNAYKTAGLSANQYMQTVTSFSASLLQSLATGTSESAEIATEAQIEALDAQYEATEEANEKRLDALSESQDAEIEAFKKATDEKIKLIDKQYMENLKLIDEEKYNQLKAIDEQIAALNGLTEAERQAQKEQEQQEKIAQLQEKINLAASVGSRKKAEDDLAKYLAEIEQDKVEAEREAQIDALKAQKDTINEEADAKKEALKEQRDAEVEAVKESSDAQLKELKKAHKAELDALKQSNKDKLKEVEAYVEQQKAILESVTPTAVYTEQVYEQAADYADMAITDMSDNANKMGTSMESIQNAYQGFAKQNYTMLDNLKLGYGGTKTEMERLISDAAKLDDTIVEGDMSFANIVKSIHAVQTEMGITGTTALEAGSTIQGSVASMSAAWTNLITGLGDDNADLGVLIDNFVTSLVGDGTNGGVLGNILPRVEKIINGIGDLVVGIAPIISKELPKLVKNTLPKIISSATELIKGLVEALPDLIGAVVDEVPNIIDTIVLAAVELLPEIVQLGIDLLVSLANGISQSLPTLIPTIVDVILKMVEVLTDPTNLSHILDAALILIESLVQGITDSLPRLVDGAIQIINNLVSFLTDEENLDKVFDTAIEIITALLDGITGNLPSLLDAAVSIIKKLVAYITDPENLNKIVDSAVAIVLELANFIIENLPMLLDAAIEIILAIVTGIIDYIATPEGLAELLETAVELVVALGKAVIQSVGYLADAAVEFVGELWDSISEALGLKNWFSLGETVSMGIASGLNGDINSRYGKDGFALGAQTAAGVERGLHDTWGDVEGEMRDGLNGVVLSAERTLDIHSPSKVFARIGEFMALGLGEGWSDKIGNIKKDIDKSVNFEYNGIDAIGRYKNGIGSIPPSVGTTISGVNITIDASKVGDAAEDIAEAVAEALQNLTDRRVAAYG